MITVKQYEQMKAKAEELTAKAERAKGEHTAALAVLKQRGYGTIKGAKQAVAKLEEEVTQLEEEYNIALAAFEDEWGAQLSD